MADFQNGLISGIFSVFSSGFFAQNSSKWGVHNRFFMSWDLRYFKAGTRGLEGKGRRDSGL